MKLLNRCIPLLFAVSLIFVGCDSVNHSATDAAENAKTMAPTLNSHGPSSSSSDVEVVNPANVDEDWSDAATKVGGEVDFVQDWGAPSGFGDASLELSTIDDNQSKASLLTGRFAGTPLSDISELSYWSYQASGPALGAPSFQVQISLDGGDTFCGTMVFEPYWQNELGDPAPVESGKWQEWANAEDGFWWSTCGPLGTGIAGPPFTSVTDVANNFPNAVVLAIGTSIGTFNPDWTVAVDGLKFETTSETTVFNFDVVPATKDDCKDGGWQVLADGNGDEFVNQGDCVSYVASHGRTRGPKK